MTAPVPERVYDAALRVICREPWADDATILEAWYKGERALSDRDIALKVLRAAMENGIAYVCRG